MRLLPQRSAPSAELGFSNGNEIRQVPLDVTPDMGEVELSTMLVQEG
jgi:hypothetical protein